MRLYPFFLLTGALLVHATGTAEATISHTWVSSTGNNANACTRSAPCATFAGALAKTSAGGEIDVADAGDYGPVTISQAVSIEAVGVLATIQVSSGNAITVTAGPSDVVVLRGLTLDGQEAASDGISFSTGGSLYVENCRVHRFNTGIDFLPTGGSSLFVTDTIVRNSGTGTITGTTGCGVYIQAGIQGFATASIDGLRAENNVCGVKTVNGAKVAIRNSIAVNNSFAGFSVVQSSNNPSLLIENSVTAQNGTYGVLSVDNSSGLSPVSPVIRLSNVTVTGNQTGMAVSGTSLPGVIISFGNNKNDGNVTNGAPTSTITQQ